MLLDSVVAAFDPFIKRDLELGDVGNLVHLDSCAFLGVVDSFGEFLVCLVDLVGKLLVGLVDLVGKLLVGLVDLIGDEFATGDDTISSRVVRADFVMVSRMRA